MPPELAAKDNVAVLDPDAPGVKVTAIEQVPPEPSTMWPLVQVVLAPFTIANSPAFVPVTPPGVVIVTWLAPALIKNTARDALVCPTV